MWALQMGNIWATDEYTVDGVQVSNLLALFTPESEGYEKTQTVHPSLTCTCCFFFCRFGIEKTESLAKELSAEELETFAFNVRQLDWADYLYNVHIPGLRNYVLKGRGTRN